MSELDKTSTKIIIDEEVRFKVNLNTKTKMFQEEEEVVLMSDKELEEEKKKAKELQARNVSLTIKKIKVFLLNCRMTQRWWSA